MIIEEYIRERENLKNVFMLIDFRHKPTDDDVLMYNYLKYYNIPVTVVATKADKVSRNNYNKNISVIKETLNISNNDNLVLFSTINKEGKQEIHDIIESFINDRT